MEELGWGDIETFIDSEDGFCNSQGGMFLMEQTTRASFCKTGFRITI